MTWKQTVKKLEKALDSLLDAEAKCREMGRGNTFSEAIGRIRALINTAEELDTA